jgi:hypothetical protein
VNLPPPVRPHLEGVFARTRGMSLRGPPRRNDRTAVLRTGPRRGRPGDLNAARGRLLRRPRNDRASPPSPRDLVTQAAGSATMLRPHPGTAGACGGRPDEAGKPARFMPAAARTGLRRALLAYAERKFCAVSTPQPSGAARGSHKPCEVMEPRHATRAQKHSRAAARGRRVVWHGPGAAAGAQKENRSTRKKFRENFPRSALRLAQGVLLDNSGGRCGPFRDSPTNGVLVPSRYCM